MKKAPVELFFTAETAKSAKESQSVGSSFIQAAQCWQYLFISSVLYPPS
ncbi:MAG: hypothetical protein K2P88_02705 [Chitinophagaceae bacterium]|nr:hypothetical protein [Chitinophagaceae bacterium]